MDVDAMNFQNKYADGRPNFTHDKKEALKKSGGCFLCGIVRHNAHNCCKYPQASRANGRGSWSGGTGLGNRPNQGWGSTPQVRIIEAKLQFSIDKIDAKQFWGWANTQPEEEHKKIAQKILKMSGFP